MKTAARRKFDIAVFSAILLLGLLSAAEISAGEKDSAADDALRQRAVAGEVNAQLELANEFFFGTDKRTANAELAAWWFRKAAENGSVEAQYNYAVCLEHGWGVTRSLHAALDMYKSAEQLPAARLRMAKIILAGVPAEESADKAVMAAIPPAPAAALSALRKLAEEKYPPAWLELALLLKAEYDNDFSTEKNQQRDAEMRKLAELAASVDNADPKALLLCAELRRRAIGGRVDESGARKLILIAAESGNPAALTQLAKDNENITAEGYSAENAIKLYKLAADAGDPEAMCVLASHYLIADTLPQDIAEADSLLTKAVAADYPPAFAMKGDLLFYGIGCEKDQSAAAELYIAGAKKGDPDSQLRLGRCYKDGTGVIADPTAAVFWFKCAGARGKREAVRELAIALLNGEGVVRDQKEGMRLLQAAAAAGDETAAGLLRL
jgi:TPR repeat protein